MTTPTTLRDCFATDVTRDIAPVVYFHEQAPDQIAQEVAEYIITGGWPDEHPNHKRVPNGIHEQYVRLLGAIADLLDRPQGADLPASWISGFYGSGKSSFAKLLGLALDGMTLPDGRPLAAALLARDTSPHAAALRAAWDRLAGMVDPVSVVFDIGGTARDGEPIHSAILRQVQRRLGYCKDAWVANYELRLEREGQWADFLAAFSRGSDAAWDDVKDKEFSEDEFSAGLHRLRPDLYPEPLAWVESREGTRAADASPNEATRAIGDMLTHRAPDKTLFIVVDEISQYIHQDQGRMLALQSFVSDLGQRLKGRVWLLVTGQEKLDQAGDRVVLSKMKDRFPPRLRVHLAATNIRDVVHRRLLDKSAAGAAALRPLLDSHRNDLRLFAYDCADRTLDELVETYPLLPGHIELLLEITSALRVSSARAQGDDQNIRGLLQLLGELFREGRLADRPVGALVTLDDVYDVQATALSSDAQNTMRRVLAHCARHPGQDLAVSCAKAVALLQLIQEDQPTTADLVARCLFDRLDRGDRLGAVTAALEALRADNLLGYSEKLGYKLQSAAGEEWEDERRRLPVSGDHRSKRIQSTLEYLMAVPDQPRLSGRRFPWAAHYTDHRPLDLALKRANDPASVTVDLRWLAAAARDASDWIRRSDEDALRDRLVWVAGPHAAADDLAAELHRSAAMIAKYEPHRNSLPRDRQMLLLQEQTRAEDLATRLRDAVDRAFMDGDLYLRGERLPLGELGASFASALFAAGERALPGLYPHLVATNVTDAELQGLLNAELAGISTKFLSAELGILTLDGGKYVATCEGALPQRILAYITDQQGCGGDTVQRHFSGPPYGALPNVIRACVLGLLHARRIKIVDEGKRTLAAVRDAGVRDVFVRDRDFKRAQLHPPDEGPVSRRDLARIAELFQDDLKVGHMERDEVKIAEGVEGHFHGLNARLVAVEARLNQLRPSPATPQAMTRLKAAIEDCIRQVRQTEATVKAVARHLDHLRDGMRLLRVYEAELTDDAIAAVRAAHAAWEHRYTQLAALPEPPPHDVRAAGERLEQQLTSERPWQAIDTVSDAIAAVTDAYEARRQALIDEQFRKAEGARDRLKARPGFNRLTADQSNHVLRPLTEVLTRTDAAATQPPLVALGAPFNDALRQAEEVAQDHLDGILADVDERPVVKVRMRLQNKVITSPTDLEAVLTELRQRVDEQLRSGKHVRLTIGS